LCKKVILKLFRDPRLDTSLFANCHQIRDEHFTNCTGIPE